MIHNYRTPLITLVAVLCSAIVVVTYSGCANVNNRSLVSQESMKTDLSVGKKIDHWIDKANQHKMEFSDDREKRCLRAILRNVEKGWWTTKSIVYEVYYDENRIITSCKINESYTGP